MSQVIKKSGISFFPDMVEDFFNVDRLWDPNIFNFDNNRFFKRMLTLPAANISETEGEYIIEMAAPGLERKDFKIEVNNDLLSISAQKENEKKDESKNLRRREYSFNSFSRTFVLPENLNTEKVDAKYLDGELIVKLPKKELSQAKPHKLIEVK